MEKSAIEKDLAKICFCFAILGLVLIYVFSPENIYSHKTVFELSQKCEGPVKISSQLVKVFYSSKGSLIGLFEEENASVFIFLKNYSVIGGEQILVKGKADLHKQQCWLFPDNLEIIR